MMSESNLRKWERPVDLILSRHVDKTGTAIDCQSVCYEFPPLVSARV
jgi:hypothetical protein